MKEKLLQKVRATAAKVRERYSSLAPTDAKKPADSPKMTLVPDAVQKNPGEKATLLTQQLPDSPSGKHGGEFCLPCPSKGDCFFGGQNKLKKISLGSLDEPLPDDADPRAVAAREALIKGDLKLGSAGELSYVDPKTGETLSITGTPLRVAGEGIAILVKDAPPIGETKDVSQKLNPSIQEKQIPTPEPLTQLTPTIPIETPSLIVSTQSTTAAPVEITTPVQKPPISETVSTPIVATLKPITSHSVSELRTTVAPVIKSPEHRIVSSQVKSVEATKPTPVTVEPVVHQVTTKASIIRLEPQRILPLPGIPERRQQTQAVVEQKTSAAIEAPSPQVEIKMNEDKKIRPENDEALPVVATSPTETVSTKRKQAQDTTQGTSPKRAENSQPDTITPTIRDSHRTQFRTFHTLRGGLAKQQEQQPRQKEDMPRKKRIRARIERSVPARLSELVARANNLFAQDTFAPISLITNRPRAHDIHSEKQQTEVKNKDRKKRRSKKISLDNAFDMIKVTPTKRKNREIFTTSFSEIKKEVSTKKLQIDMPKADNPTQETKQLRRKKIIKRVKARKIKMSQETKLVKPRPILTKTRREALYAKMRGEIPMPRRTNEIYTIDQTKPLILVIPEQARVEEVAGAIVQIAKEKQKKEKTPPVQLRVAGNIYQKLKEIFGETISTQEQSQSNTIQIASETEIFSIDITKIMELAALFSGFEAQNILTQLHQCLSQTETMQATVLCGCQQQDAATTFEKISFCQGCHTANVQQTLFWLITIFWCMILESLTMNTVLSLDQKSSSWYTNQSYE